MPNDRTETQNSKKTGRIAGIFKDAVLLLCGTVLGVGIGTQKQVRNYFDSDNTVDVSNTRVTVMHPGGGWQTVQRNTDWSIHADLKAVAGLNVLRKTEEAFPSVNPAHISFDNQEWSVTRFPSVNGSFCLQALTEYHSKGNATDASGKEPDRSTTTTTYFFITSCPPLK